MPTFKVLPQPQAYGFKVGVILLNMIEAHVPGDTAHAGTYDYPVLFKVVDAARGDSVISGDKSIEPAIVEAARELERMGVKAISSNCGFMLHYQDTVSRAVNIPVGLSSLLQIPFISSIISPDKKIAVLTALQDCLTRELLKKAGVPDGREIVTCGIGNADDFKSIADNDINTESLLSHLEDRCDEMIGGRDDIGALLLECAIFTPYSSALQRRYNIPTFDFVSMIDFLHYTTNLDRRSQDRY